jgi:hypothetical protein
VWINLRYDVFRYILAERLLTALVDREFHHWMAMKFGHSFTDLNIVKKGPGSALMKEFELLKKDFSSNHDEDIKFRVPLVMNEVHGSSYYDSQMLEVIFYKQVSIFMKTTSC